VTDPVLGVVMLNTRFPRPVGDIGNPASFPFRTLYRTVAAATVERVVTPGEIDGELADAIGAAARELAGEGATLITTSCGFLAPLQKRLAQQTEATVLVSAIDLLPAIRRRHARRPIGVLTIDGRCLVPAHFGSLWDDDLIVEGVENGQEIHRVVTGDLHDLDSARARRDLVDAGRRLLGREPEIGSILLECTNFPPYRGAIRDGTGCPVYDLVTALIRIGLGQEPLGDGAARP